MRTVRSTILSAVLVATLTFVAVALFLHSSILREHQQAMVGAELSKYAKRVLALPSSERLNEVPALERECLCKLHVKQSGTWNSSPTRSTDWLSNVVEQDEVIVHAQRLRDKSSSKALTEVLLIAGLLSLLMGFVSALVMSNNVQSHVQELKRVTQRLGKGDMSARMSAGGSDLSDVALSLGEMASVVSSRMDKLSSEQERLRTILNSMVEGVFVTDARGTIVSTNAALDAIVPNAKGRTVMEAIRNPRLHEAVTAARNGSASSVELRAMVNSDPHILDAEVAPLAEGGGVVAVMHDVTKLHLADKIRRDFVANASHELRTPLTAIRGFTETLQNGALSDPQTAERFLGIIHEHTLRLSRIVDDLVALSRAESSEQAPELQELDLSIAVEQVVRGLSERASAAELELQMGDLDVPKVLGDRDHLDQILINLVENGIRYTPAPGLVKVSARTDEDAVILDVFNTATIASKHLPRLFERFYRVDKGRARKVGGTGLGLAIVRHLVLGMQGDINVVSDEAGTTFSVRLPLSTTSRN